MADIQMTMDATTGKAVEAFLKVVEAQKKVKDGAHEVTRATKDADDTMGKLGSTAESVVGRLTGIATVTGSIAAGMKLITAEFDAWRDRGNAAADVMTSLAQKMGAAFLQMPAGMQFGQLNAAVESATRATGVPRASVFPAATQMLPNLGTGGMGIFTQALTIASDLQAKTGLPAGPTGSSILELARRFPNATAQQVAGWGIQQGQAGELGVGPTLEGLPRTLNVMGGFGWKEAESAGLIQLAAEYVKGPEGFTVAEQFARGLANLVPGAEKMTGIQQLAAGKALYAAAGDETQREKLRAAVGRGAAAQSFAGAVLTGREALPEVAGPGVASARIMADLQGGLARLPGMDIALGEQRGAAGAEAIRMESPFGAGRAAAARRLRQFVEPLPLGVFGGKVTMAEYWGDVLMGYSPEEAEARALEAAGTAARWRGASQAQLAPLTAESRALDRLVNRLDASTNPSAMRNGN